MPPSLGLRRDAFLSHASEDKDDVARLLAAAIEAKGFSVWFDEYELTLGDSLSESIDRGLARSRMGVVVISRAFLAKRWPRRELRGLVGKEMAEDRNVILPVWHGVTHAEVAAASPPLADLLAVNTNNGMPAVADSVARALRRNRIADLVECYLDAVAADRDRVGAGDLLTVGCRVVNPGNRPAKLELGASLVGREGPTYVDPAADTAIEVEPQSVSVHERRFRVPANAERGSYDLVLALWVGPPGRDGLRVHARSAEHGIDVL